MLVADVTGFILAGGQSSRMGSDKALLELGGRLLIDHAMRRLRTFKCDIFIVGPKEKFNSFGRILEDRVADAGPLAGIHRALERSETELNIVTGVDIPLVPAALLQKLADVARAEDTEVVLPKTAGGFQPLCAIYKKEFFGVVDAALKAGKRKIDEVIFARPHTIFDVERAGFAAEDFLNINTAEDLKQAEAVFNAQAKAARP